MLQLDIAILTARILYASYYVFHPGTSQQSLVRGDIKSPKSRDSQNVGAGGGEEGGKKGEERKLSWKPFGTRRSAGFTASSRGHRWEGAI